MSDNQWVANLICIIAAIAVICFIFGAWSIDSNCIDWHKDTGGQMYTKFMSCRVRINETDWINYRHLDDNLNRLDLDYAYEVAQWE
jgi:hypothetical protein